MRKRNNTIPTQTAEIAEDMWGEKLILAMMIGGPLYLGLIIIMLAYTIIRHRQRGNRMENEGQ